MIWGLQNWVFAIARWTQSPRWPFPGLSTPSEKVSEEPSARKFKVGQSAEYFPPQGIWRPHGTYLVMEELPERAGEFEYVIKHPSESYERVARESELRGAATALFAA
jgi:hypothetical protein